MQTVKEIADDYYETKLYRYVTVFLIVYENETRYIFDPFLGKNCHAPNFVLEDLKKHKMYIIMSLIA